MDARLTGRGDGPYPGRASEPLATVGPPDPARVNGFDGTGAAMEKTEEDLRVLARKADAYARFLENLSVPAMALTFSALALGWAVVRPTGSVALAIVVGGVSLLLAGTVFVGLLRRDAATRRAVQASMAVDAYLREHPCLPRGTLCRPRRSVRVAVGAV